MTRIRFAGVVILIAALAIAIAGCGGGGGGSSLTQGSGIVKGLVQEFPSATKAVRSGDSITVGIDGTEISTVAAANGSFTLTGVPAGLHTLVAQTQGRARALVVSVETGKETDVGEVILQDAGQISGLVTSASTHQPLVDALVSVIEQVATMTDEMPHPVRVRHTNELGSYTIAGLPAGDYVVTISKQGYQAVSLALTVNAQATTPGDAALEPVAAGDMGSVAGTAYLVKDSGDQTPIAGVLIRLVGQDDSPDVPPLPPSAIGQDSKIVSLDNNIAHPIRDGYYAFTGEDGTYRIDGVIPGQYIAVAVRPGLEIAHQAVTVTASTVSQVDFNLTMVVLQVGVVEGLVTDSATNQPIAGADVSAVWGPVPMPMPLDPGGGSVVMPGGGDNLLYCKTDEHGHYRLIVPAKVTAIAAWAENYDENEVDVTVNPGSSVTVNIALTPSANEPPPPPPGGGGDTGGGGTGGGDTPPAPPGL